MKLEIALRGGRPEAARTPLLAVLLARGGLPASLKALDRRTKGALRRVLASGDFAGGRDEAVLLHPEGPATRLLLVGLGDADGLTPHAVRRAAGAAAKRARAAKVASMAMHLPAEVLRRLDAAEAGQALVEGLGRGAWEYRDLKQPATPPKPALTTATLLAPDAPPELARGVEVGTAVAAAQWLARDLQVLPGNMLPPAALAEHAEALGKRHRRVTVKVMDPAAMAREGLRAHLAVAQGSAQPPRFIVLEYGGATGKPVVLVGKGITFDTGGISLKPSDKMEEMKFDMSGAAAVLGAFEMLGRLQPAIRVVGLIPTAENMPSANAYKPGDVVRSHFGKTIEVVNTDAEGRLLLADALSYARKFKPAAVVDIATLTGAVVIALGPHATGILGSDDGLVTELAAAGERAGERTWRLPMWDEYAELIKSDVADVKNSGGRPAGTITAAMFLREFVEGFPWAHLDVAGTAYTGTAPVDGERGPAGTGTRLFCAFLLARAQ